ncbi:hypothetical protein ABEH87_00885 [Erwinia sp. Eh17-17]|uniref:hypothetical protein n=1 Tax=Erwinia sp. Eh17-17 TaxID=3080330 RepID=UPI00320A777F
MNSTLAAIAVMLFASWTSNALAGNSQAAVNSGTILFVGSIVESPCESGVQQGSLQVSCLRNGKTQTTTLALNTTASQPMPHNIGRSQIKWLDGQHRLGILTMEYQ